MPSDAIVIGAGHNGLVAANLLADAGWSVTVVEATSEPGGAVRTAELTAPGYLNDVFSAFYPMVAASPVMAGLGLDRYGLRLRDAPDVLAHVLPDGRAAVLNRDPQRTAVSVEKFAPGDGDRWLAEFDQWRRISTPLTDALFAPFPPVRPAFGLWRRAGAGGLLRLARRALLPARKLGEELYAGEGARLLLAGCALHTDLGPDEAAGGIYGWLLTMIGQERGWPVPEGGAGRLTDALVARLTARGGRILYASPVTRVIVRNGDARGVELADGRRLGALRAVVADVPAPALFLDLVDPGLLPPRLLADLRHFRWDGSTVKIDWALTGPVPWTDGSISGAGTVHLDCDLDDLAAYAHDLACGRVPERPFVLAGQMTTADPTRSPAGTESLWAYTHLPHRVDWPAEEIDRQVARVEEIMERHAPGFRALVAARHVAGPGQMSSLDPSLVGGAVGGGTSAAYQQLVWRPVPGLGRADTPVDRLFLASSSAHPGGGVHGGPGANAARAALRRNGFAGEVYEGLVRAAHRSVYK